MSNEVLADPWDILIGLRPELVRSLANLAGSTQEDLLVTFQVMPWGDRATLAGYGVLELARNGKAQGRVVSVHPEAIDLVNVAASMVNTTLTADTDHAADATFRAIGHDAELLAGAALPLIEVVHDQIAANENCVPGIVEHIESIGRLGRVQIRILLGAGSTDQTIEITTDDPSELHDGLEVALCYSNLRDPLTHPKSLHPLNG